MKNFEDVLLQRNLDYGPLWCDEGVYRIAKEIQLLNPGTFNNIFLGLGGFHMEKVIIACCGIFLKGTGIECVLVESMVFGSGVVNSVMPGGNYIRGKRGMVLIAEALQQLQYTELISSNEMHPMIYITICSHFKMFKNVQTCESTNWKHHENLMNDFLFCLDAFIKDASKKSSQFKFWTIFLSDIVSVLLDLTRSHTGELGITLSAVRRAIPLFFGFDRTNYKRWVPLYFEDCLSLMKQLSKAV